MLEDVKLKEVLLILALFFRPMTSEVGWHVLKKTKGEKGGEKQPPSSTPSSSLPSVSIQSFVKTLRHQAPELSVLK